MKPNHPSELSARIRSFGYAFEGWVYVIRNEHNAWIHALLTLFAAGLAAWLGITRVEWAILVLAMGIVWMGEIMNTAIEALVDMTSPEPHPLAKVAKDTAAGAVMAAALAALIVGLIILGPPLWLRLFG